MKGHHLVVTFLFLLCVTGAAIAQTITTIAGGGTVGFGGDGGPASQAKLYFPRGIAFDSSGDLIFADNLNLRIRKISVSGTISTVAGNGQSSNGSVISPGPALASPLYDPTAVAVGKDGSIYFRDFGTCVVNPTGNLTPDYVTLVYGFAVDSQGTIYGFTFGGTAIFVYQPGVAPQYIAGDPNNAGDGGDNGPALQAHFSGIGGLAADASGNIYVSDTAACRIRKFQPGGQIVTIAGNGTCANAPDVGDGGPGTNAQLLSNGSLTLDSAGNLYFADGSERIRKIDSRGIINAYAGALGGSGYTGEGGPALKATFAADSLAVDSQGNLFVTTNTQNRILKITPSVGTTTNPPVIAAVISAAANVPGLTPGAWVSIYGQNLSTTSRAWGSSDFNGNTLPTSLDGVGVTVDGKAAAVLYISPGQIDAQVPDDATQGQVAVVVTNSGTASAPFNVTMNPVAPSFFVIDAAQHVAALNPDYSLVAPVGLTKTSRPAAPGEIVALYGTGFGPTTPPTPSGVIVTTASKLSGQFALSVTIGGVNAPVEFAGIVGAGLWQINVKVPQVANGNQPLKATLGTTTTQDGPTLPVQQ